MHHTDTYTITSCLSVHFGSRGFCWDIWSVRISETHNYYTWYQFRSHTKHRSQNNWNIEHWVIFVNIVHRFPKGVRVVHWTSSSSSYHSQWHPLPPTSTPARCVDVTVCPRDSTVSSQQRSTPMRRPSSLFGCSARSRMNWCKNLFRLTLLYKHLNIRPWSLTWFISLKCEFNANMCFVQTSH